MALIHFLCVAAATALQQPVAQSSVRHTAAQTVQRLPTAPRMALLPQSVSQLLPTAVREDKGVLPLWKAVKAVYPTEQEALLAIRKNPAIMLPYLNCAENVRGSYKVIVDFCGKEDAEEILRKNPGVLGCIPSRLAGSNADQIRNAANFANAADTLLAPVRRLLQGIPGWDEDNNKLEQALGLQGRSKRK